LWGKFGEMGRLWNQGLVVGAFVLAANYLESPFLSEGRMKGGLIKLR
jgi:hypothetical protein